MEWIICKKELPEIGTRCFLLYSNGKVSGGKYTGERVFDVDFQDEDKSVFVFAWMRQTLNFPITLEVLDEAVKE